MLVTAPTIDDPAAGLTIDCTERLLVVRFPHAQEVASWAIWNGGRRQAPAVAWVAVRNSELPVGVDPREVCGQRLHEAGLAPAVGLLTSGALQRFRQAEACVDGVGAHAVATVGLSNAVRIGDPPGPLAPIGTINVLCAVSVPLSEEAALEALSIVTEARTAAVLEAGYGSRRSPGVATGTGTDCVVLAWPPTQMVGSMARPPESFAGKHTTLGHVIGHAVARCVRAGVVDWLERHTVIHDRS